MKHKPIQASSNHIGGRMLGEFIFIYVCTTAHNTQSESQSCQTFQDEQNDETSDERSCLIWSFLIAS